MTIRREYTNAIVLWPDEWFEPGTFVATGFRWYVMPSSIPCGADPATAKPALERDVLRDDAGCYLTFRYSPDLARTIRDDGFTGPIYRVSLVRVQGHFSHSPGRLIMALGTNYARIPTRKMEDRFHLEMAKLAIREGVTRDQYIASVKPVFAKRAGEFYDQAIRSHS